jgi:hemerythrin
MPLFTWNNTYSVDNEELDSHHKRLFDIFNRMYDNSLNHDKANTLDLIIEELISYSHYHFLAEEQYMKNIRYKELLKHMIEHMRFSQKIVQLQQDVKNNEPEATKDLIAFLGEWLLNHVMMEDKRYLSK